VASEILIGMNNLKTMFVYIVSTFYRFIVDNYQLWSLKAH